MDKDLIILVCVLLPTLSSYAPLNKNLIRVKGYQFFIDLIRCPDVAETLSG